MLLLVNQIFNSTNRAVSRGIELSEVVSNERAVKTLLQEDAEQMVGPETGPGDGAPLVIIQHRVDNRNLDFAEANGINLDAIPTPSVTDVKLRADQLMFVRNRGRELPTTPSATNTFASNAGSSAQVPYARVWYGHLLRMNDNGSPPPVTDDLDNATNFLDQNPASWLLGRQALFLVNDGGVAPSPIHSNGGWVTAPVVGYTPAADAPPFASLLVLGLSDTAYFALRESEEGPHGSLISELEANSNEPGFVLGADLADPDYQDRAVGYFSFGKLRLRTMDRPPSADFKSWEVAQSHPILAEGVSDFIVEFAADADLDGLVDLVTAGESSTAAGSASGTAAGLPANAFANNIKWYTHDDYANNGAGFDADLPLTFALPAGAVRTATYRDFTATGPAAALAPFEAATAAFVFRHDAVEAGTVEVSTSTGVRGPLVVGSKPCYWPYLLRIRYRMHDARGDLGTEQDTNGVWFEKIIRVNRPFPVEVAVP